MTDPGSTRARGRAVEALVAEFLQRHGLRIVAQNVELAHAELDLVALDDRSGESVYVFIEVRSRSGVEQGTPLETIGPRKRARLARAATAWLVREGLWEQVPVRFDVVGVITPVEGTPSLEWIVDAFEA